MPHADENGTIVGEHPQCDPIKTRIIHVGMGASGMLAAHKAKKFLSNYELICYEKNSSPGGTWWENRYPGVACDIPAHTYTFPFDANPEWSEFYAGAAEIHRYFMNFYEKNELAPFVKLNTEVVEAEWHDLEGLWHVTLKDCLDGSTFVDKANVIINGSGVLTKWKWPAIEGLHSFKGALAHSANWPQDLKWDSKRVGVIGTGSSSIQMVPHIAETASNLTVFMRNNTYIAPPFGSNISNKEADPDAMEPGAAGKHKYTEKEKQRFREDPAYHLKYRTTIERQIANGGWDMFTRGSELNILVKNGMQESMRQRLAHRDDLKEKIIPTWSPGCRRLTPGDGYLEALIRENVICEFNDIARVTETGIETVDGKHHELDVLACATGFNVQYQPHFKIIGKGGQVMQDAEEPNVYASIAVPGFPNYFVINGPRGNWGQGCALPSHEVQMEYIMQCCRKMQEDRIKSMEPKEDITTQLNKYMDAWHTKQSIWAEDCKSWYKDNQRNGRVYIWPGSLLHILKFLKRPRYEHYNIAYANPDNIWDFLGCGKTSGQVRLGPNAPVDYIRSEEDIQWDIE